MDLKITVKNTTFFANTFKNCWGDKTGSRNQQFVYLCKYSDF